MVSLFLACDNDADIVLCIYSCFSEDLFDVKENDSKDTHTPNHKRRRKKNLVTGGIYKSQH